MENVSHIQKMMIPALLICHWLGDVEQMNTEGLLCLLHSQKDLARAMLLRALRQITPT